MASKDTISRILQIVKQRDLPAKDIEFFNRFIALLDVERGPGDRFAIAIDLFYEYLRRCIMMNGSTRSVHFLMRNMPLMASWKRVWQFLEEESASLEYCGTDSPANYVLSLILQSSADLALPDSSSSISTAVQQTTQISPELPSDQYSSELGVYEFVEEADAASSDQCQGLDDIDADDLCGIDHAFSSSDWDIPEALQRRYQTQATFVVVNRSDRLERTVLAIDHESAMLITGVFEQLSTIHRDEQNRESVIASPELLKPLYMIDRYAITHGHQQGCGFSVDQLKRLLIGDRDLMRNAYALLREAVSEVTGRTAVLLDRFIVGISERLIWNMAVQNSRQENRTMSFRTEIHMESMRNDSC